ncbi:MAG: hypothetical protein ACPGUV_10935, partial [Polyangiales bacterium]
MLLCFAACEDSRPKPSLPRPARRTLDSHSLRLFVVPALQGHLGASGCPQDAGGDVARLKTHIEVERHQRAPLLLVFVGDVFFRQADAPVAERRAGSTADLALWRADALADVLRQMQVSALLPSGHDLRYGATALRHLVRRARASSVLWPTGTDAPTIAARLPVLLHAPPPRLAWQARGRRQGTRCRWQLPPRPHTFRPEGSRSTPAVDLRLGDFRGSLRQARRCLRRAPPL